MNSTSHGIDVLFVRKRITELRERKGVSQYQMSLDLEKAKGYIQCIEGGRALPSFVEFFKICDYFNITPKEFFDNGVSNPVLFNRLVERIRPLDEPTMVALSGIFDVMNI